MEVGQRWNHLLEKVQGDSRVLTSAPCLSELPNCYYPAASAMSESALLLGLAEPATQRPLITQEGAEQPAFLTNSQHQGNPQLLPLARLHGNSPKCFTFLDMR